MRSGSLTQRLRKLLAMLTSMIEPFDDQRMDRPLLTPWEAHSPIQVFLVQPFHQREVSRTVLLELAEDATGRPVAAQFVLLLIPGLIRVKVDRRLLRPAHPGR